MENYYFITAVSIKQHEKNKHKEETVTYGRGLEPLGEKGGGVLLFLCKNSDVKLRILSASFKCFYFSNNPGFFLQTVTIKVNKICGKC